jgi:hypothetical protein
MNDKIDVEELVEVARNYRGPLTGLYTLNVQFSGTEFGRMIRFKVTERAVTRKGELEGALVFEEFVIPGMILATIDPRAIMFKQTEMVLENAHTGFQAWHQKNTAVKYRRLLMDSAGLLSQQFDRPFIPVPQVKLS